MIIEAGYDMGTLLGSRLFTARGSQRKTRTWVIALDEDLHYIHTRKVGGDSSEPIASRIPNIVKALNKHPVWPVAYYVLAHLDTDLHRSFENQRSNDYFPELHDLDSTLRQAPELSDHELLGVYMSSGQILCGTVPRYSFRDYPLLDHLPRTAIIPGPHEYPCECVACTRHEEMLRRNRERYQEQNPVPEATGS